MMTQNEASWEALFTERRTPRDLSSRPVEEDVLRRLYDLVKMGPTSGNCTPGRFAFLTTDDAKEPLRPALSAGNVERALRAPVVAIIGHDPMFFEQLPRVGTLPGLRDWFAADVGLSEETAFRNGTLQGGYFILAARMLGLDALPMSGFDSLMVEERFFREQGWRANFLVALGYPAEDAAPLPERAPRLSFEEACLCL